MLHLLKAGYGPTATSARRWLTAAEGRADAVSAPREAQFDPKQR